MAHAYTPGLIVARRTRRRWRRLLPIRGEVLVQPGDRVEAQQVVAQTFMPGDITPLNLANLLSVSPADLPDCLLKKVGERVEVGEPLARTKGIFGFFKTEYRSKVAGTIESVSNVTGQVLIRGEPTPVQVRAFVSGRVVEVVPEEGAVIEADVCFVQGIFGVGGETYGRLKAACSRPDEPLTADKVTPDMKGCVVVGGSRMTGEAVRKAIEVGASAVVSGGMDDQDLRNILGYDLGVAVTGSERIGVTLVITEGFGEIAMARRTFELLTSLEGRPASVNGATQIRAGVVRPEVVVELDETAADEPADEPAAAAPDRLEVGATVRIIREPYFGRIGQVAALPSEPQVLPSESRARVLHVQLSSDETVVVPRANVELITE